MCTEPGYDSKRVSFSFVAKADGNLLPAGSTGLGLCRSAHGSPKFNHSLGLERAVVSFSGLWLVTGSKGENWQKTSALMYKCRGGCQG